MRHTDNIKQKEASGGTVEGKKPLCRVYFPVHVIAEDGSIIVDLTQGLDRSGKSVSYAKYFTNK
jgi:hypothetical protein